MIKKNNKIKKNKCLRIIFIIIVTIIIILVTLKYQNISIKKDIIKIKVKNHIQKDYKLYTNYNDLKKDFELSKIKQKDFENNNILVIKIDYDPCSEEDINITKYKLNKNKIDIYIEYKADCGVCAREQLYYAIKLNKKITDPKLNIKSKAKNNPNCNQAVAYKPMIYLYPQEKTEVKIVLKNKKLLTTTYPKYINSWEVIANPDGTLIDKESGREYYGLYWEGKNYTEINMKKGFVIKGKNTIKFLEEKLNELGLTDKEAEEFIVYWLPKLEKNTYNYIYFAQTEEVNNYMPLEITPKPDSLIRILMYYKPLNKKISVKTQKINKVYRKDFTVVEWGGTKIK